MKRTVPDYLKLFIRRESKIVLGKHYSNVWLLTAVLTATFLAIAFSNGSLNYLNFKMNDPFIKWVDIKNDNLYPERLDSLKRRLADPANQQRYHYSGYSYDYEYSWFFFGKTDAIRPYLKCRYFDASNLDLVRAILDDDNRVVGIPPQDVDEISPRSMGVFLTERSLSRLGYKEAPAYIDLYQYSPGASELGFKEVDGRVRVPVPLLAVVKRLPGGADVVAFTNLYRQQMNAAESLFMNKEEYATSLCYFLPEFDVDEDAFDARLQALVEEETDIPFILDNLGYDPKELYSFKNRVQKRYKEDGYEYVDHWMGFRQVFSTDTVALPALACSRVNERLLAEFPGKDIHRIYKYTYSTAPLSTGDYLSIQFEDLKEIKTFADSLVTACDLEIEMSQINAKENFQSVSVMAITLSVVMVIFAIVCILLFIVNLLQSYFQKVKRNIGTFKAFGIADGQLQQVYMTIMLVLVGVALVLSLAIVTVLQLLLRLFGAVKGDGFGYLSLWSCDVIHFCPPLITLLSIALVVAAAAVTVRLVMKNLLSATPGDLIYDR